MLFFHGPGYLFIFNLSTALTSVHCLIHMNAPPDLSPLLIHNTESTQMARISHCGAVIGWPKQLQSYSSTPLPP